MVQEREIMRILVVSSGRIPTPPRTGGGVEKYTYFLARALSQLGHQVDYVTNVSPDYKPFPGVHVIPLPAFGFSLQDSYLASGVGLLLGGTIARSRAARAMREKRYDIADFHSPISSLGALPMRVRPKIPVAFTAHNPVPWNLHAEGGLSAKLRSLTFTAIDARVASRADGVIALGTELRTSLVKELGLNPARTFMTTVGVDPTPYQLSDEVVENVRRRLHLPSRYVLFVGRFVPQKGVSLLLIALAGTGIPLVLVGDGPMFQTLTRQARDLNMAETVRFLGSCPPDELSAIYRGASVYALPSLAEGMPHVVLEAAAAGLPIVATRVEGIGAIVVEGETGHIVPIADPEALRRAIQSLFSDPTQAQRLGKNARLRAQTKFSWRAVAEKTLEAYSAIIAQTVLEPSQRHC